MNTIPQKPEDTKMLVEIWSDIMCPFCYIGKRKFENALYQFSKKDKIHVVWKSFDLAPHMQTNTDINIYQFLSVFKNMSMPDVKRLTANVTTMAKNAGLDFNFDTTIAAKTQKAHQLMHLATTHNLQNELKETLLKAYFIDGKNIDDIETLVVLSKSVGLTIKEIEDTFRNKKYLKAISDDIQDAKNLGVQGIPYFVFNKKYGVSGAQHESTFLDVLEKSFTDWETSETSKIIELTKGDYCDIDGNC